MQLALPLPAPDAPPSGPGTSGVRFVRHQRARRYILRVLDDGVVRVTLPRWGTRRDALAFLEQQSAWVTAQRSRHRERRAASRLSAVDGAVLLDGERVPLETVRDGPRVVALRCGPETVPHTDSQDPLTLETAVLSWLRARAVRQLPDELRAEAARHGIAVTRVSVRDQRSRWGSCSRRGTIALNWRLVQVPPWVRRYVLVHELMHRRELNHSPRFWALVRAACPETERARDWLRTRGPELFLPH